MSVRLLPQCEPRGCGSAWGGLENQRRREKGNRAVSLGSLYLFNLPTKELLIQQILGGLHSTTEGTVDPPEESSRGC